MEADPRDDQINALSMKFGKVQFNWEVVQEENEKLREQLRQAQEMLQKMERKDPDSDENVVNLTNEEPAE